MFERDVFDALESICPLPTFEEAMGIVRLPAIHSMAVNAAEQERAAAIQVNGELEGRGLLPLQYRGFLVGGIGIGIRSYRLYGMYEWFVWGAWNTKEQKKDAAGNEWPKICCETRIGDMALGFRCQRILAIAVVGERQPDGRSKKNRSTLDPCEVCRDNMKGKFRSLYVADTLVVTINPLTKLRRVRRTDQLMSDHGEAWWEPNSKVVSMYARGRR